MYDCLVIILHCIHTYILLAPPKGTVGTRHQVSGKRNFGRTLEPIDGMVWYHHIAKATAATAATAVVAATAAAAAAAAI